MHFVQICLGCTELLDSIVLSSKMGPKLSNMHPRMHSCTQNSLMHLAVSCFAVMHKLLAANFCQSSEDFAFEPAVSDLLCQISPVHLLLHLLVEPHRLLATAAELCNLILRDGGGGEAG